MARAKKPAPADKPAAIADALTIEWWPIARPKPYPKNARTLSDRAVDVVAASIKEFGWRQPIVVDEQDVVIVGHTRLLAGQKLECERVPIHVARNLTPAQVKAYRLADNRTADESSWDHELLEAEIAEIAALEAALLPQTGFDENEVEALLTPPPLTEDDEAPAPPETPASQIGDVWLLGKHRVMCGDSLDADAVARLVGVKLANLAFSSTASEPELDEDPAPDTVFTDPPYNVDYEGYTKGRLKIQNDAMTRAQFLAFLEATFKSYRGAVKATASLYICHPSSAQREFQDALEKAGFEVRVQIIWAKNTFAWGFGRYKFQHEPIFYAHVRNQRDDWQGDRSQSTLWMVDKPSANRLHPTMKPIALIERALANSSRPGNIVLDLFGGSGSTLIACQKTGRRARLMELDPRYADVIVDRWQQYTGLEATLEGDGRAFAAVKAARAAA